MLTKKNTNQFVNFYVICFVASYAWSYYNSLTFSTFNPVFFTNNLDFTTNLILLTNIQNLIISSKNCRILLDIVFFLLPLLLMYTHYFKIQLRSFFAISNMVYNIFYCSLISIFTCTSIQQYIPWMIIPLIFVCKNEEKFTAIFYSLRWVFLAIFLSAGLWKVATGGIFNTEQMGAILLNQHEQSFIDGTEHKILSNLIHYKKLAHFFYIAAFFAEVSFIIGFFTTRYDRYLAILFFLFIVLDYFLMEINYFSWITFVGFLYISNYTKKSITQY